MMYIALTYDHRIVDGAEAVRFLVRVKELVEDPGALLLELALVFHARSRLGPSVRFMRQLLI